ncbi:hypothetical protein [Thalassotalea sp. PS06]|uniref:hypothetical protein n=1 Tax=Thalassotalea sp. PS06 TaxID=2594005 RepID=UPI001163CD35|nr:hypothetical protein [Thalassotalea sp. PS06]QDP01663.1 hypothetical protein FNC98_10150 [Thalassotalea sp. PS06]
MTLADLCTRSTQILCVILLISFTYRDPNFLDAAYSAVLTIIPLAASNYLALLYKKPGKNKEFIWQSGFIGCFLANVFLIIYVIYTQFLFIQGAESVTIAGFYWVMFVYGATLLYSPVGFLTGAALSGLYLAVRNRA